jgi:hypothetical protein
MFWVIGFVLIVGTGAWLLTRLPKRRKKGEAPVTMDGGSMGHGA